MLHVDLIAPIHTLLERHAAARGTKIAYRDAHGAVSYAALRERTANLAGHLADLAVGEKETVAILLPNGVVWVETCFTYNGLIGLLLTGTLVAVIALLGLWSAILRRK